MRQLRHPMTIDRRRRRRTARGLTLLEVMIALVILSIGLLALSGMQVTAIRANGSGFMSTKAISLAELQLRQLKSLSYSNVNLVGSPAGVVYAAGPYAGAYTDPNSSVVYNQTYTVWEPAPIAGVKLIAYTVTWTDGGTHSVSLMSRMGNELL